MNFPDNISAGMAQINSPLSGRLLGWKSLFCEAYCSEGAQQAAPEPAMLHLTYNLKR
jgi:hypothetical protein